ncbi:hypothetical protein I6A60_24405 [Frankia sp. AgB1.9]|nr:hypothetical protein [Frankia sp. AgW1.1]MBL7550983.1 hypothetical protein [Frankia sp. AgB1.9]MBL7623627.1 hypothetical protein [Frankia sp. AgB1.8]
MGGEAAVPEVDGAFEQPGRGRVPQDRAREVVAEQAERLTQRRVAGVLVLAETADRVAVGTHALAWVAGSGGLVLLGVAGVDLPEARRGHGDEQAGMLGDRVGHAVAAGQAGVHNLPGVARVGVGAGRAHRGAPVATRDQDRAVGLGRGVEVAADLAKGGYLWRGELRIWDNHILMGWYAADDGSGTSKGTMYFALHAHGINLQGRRVGLSYDGPIVTGWTATARTEVEARALIESLKQRGIPA